MPLCSSNQEGGTAIFDSAVSCEPDEEDFLTFGQRASATQSLSEVAAKCVFAELVANRRRKKKKKNPDNYIQLLPELSHFACVIQESSSLVTRLPQDEPGLELRGWSGNGMNAFFNLLSAQNIFQLIIFLFCINSLDGTESWTWNEWSL